MGDGARGFAYEDHINSLLKKAGIQEGGFKPAKSDSNAPDGVFTYKGNKYKLELKVDLHLDFGQGSLSYDVKAKKWVLAGSSTKSGQTMRDLLTGMKVPELVNKVWGPHGAPRKFTVPLDKFKQEDVDYDYKRFSRTVAPVISPSISDYYASKDTHYIQIGAGYGLYFMKDDPAKLGCSKFQPKTEIILRIKRGHTNPIHSYGFNVALRVNESTGLTKSKVDLENPKDLQAIAARAGQK